MDRLLFTKPERNMPDDQSAIAYKKLVMRQSAHSVSLQAQFSADIEINIDEVITPKKGQTQTFRQMILGIKSHSNGPTNGMSLFQSVDFTANSGTQWFNGVRGPGGAGHIFSFYQPLEQEARQMIRGLGIFLAKTFGTRSMIKCFGQDYWRATLGWKWKTNSKSLIHQNQGNYIQI